MKLKFYFEQRAYADSTAIYLIAEDASGNRSIASPMKLEFKPLAEGLVSEPSLEFSGHMSREFFPALVDGLARSGYTYESSDKGELKATKAHLEDMRTLALRERTS